MNKNNSEDTEISNSSANLLPQQPNKPESISVFSVIEAGNLPILQRIVHEEQINLSSHKDSNGWTALHYACWNGHAHIAKFLVEKECRMDIQEVSGFTPLHCACQKLQIHLIREILGLKDLDLRWDLKDKFGKIALDYASEEIKELVNSSN
jgi:ankyrin repeat protein